MHYINKKKQKFFKKIHLIFKIFNEFYQDIIKSFIFIKGYSSYHHTFNRNSLRFGFILTHKRNYQILNENYNNYYILLNRYFLHKQYWFASIITLVWCGASINKEKCFKCHLELKPYGNFYSECRTKKFGLNIFPFRTWAVS